LSIFSFHPGNANNEIGTIQPIKEIAKEMGLYDEIHKQ
jgi:cysteine sulfinate desulfinase/cysteine desulfurase-like protein